MRFDPVGCVRMCSDAIGCISVRWEAFRHFWKFSDFSIFRTILVIFGCLLAWRAYFYWRFTCRGLTFIGANCWEVALEGSTECELCPYGRFGSYGAMAKCESCPAGISTKNRGEMSSSACTLCPRGKFGNLKTNTGPRDQILPVSINWPTNDNFVLLSKLPTNYTKISEKMHFTYQNAPLRDAFT